MSADVCRTRACRGVFVSDRSHACLGLLSVRSSDLGCCCPPTQIFCRMIQYYSSVMRTQGVVVVVDDPCGRRRSNEVQ